MVDNEFDNLDFEDEVPTPETSEVPQDNNMLSNNSSGQEYDWNLAPDTNKAPPRIDLNDKEVIIEKAIIKLPGDSVEWQKAKYSDVYYKGCMLTVFYNVEKQQEFYSGVRVFKQKDGKYSHPTIRKDGKTQAGKLYKIYAEFKNKEPTDVSLKEFMAFLNSKPTAVIKAEDFTNPEDETTVTKNIIGSFK